MGFWGGDSYVRHQKSRFRCAALSKIRNHLKKTCSTDEGKRKPDIGLSVMYEQHSYLCQKLK